MASYTLLNVLLDSGGVVDQDASTAPSSTELVNQISYADRAQKEWADAYDWPELRVPCALAVTLSATSLALPARFDRLASPVYDIGSGADARIAYRELNSPEDRFAAGSSDHYVYVGGNDAAGRYLAIHPALGSGAFIVFDYQATPSALATLNDTVTCPSRPYMAARIEYYRLLSRSDSRFPQLKVESEQILSNLIEKRDVSTRGQENAIPNVYQKRGFQVGG